MTIFDNVIIITIFYDRPQVFTILAMNAYLKITYREIIEILEVSDKMTNF